MTTSSDDQRQETPDPPTRATARTLDRIRAILRSLDVEAIVIIALGCVLALALRYTLRGFQSGDYERYTSKWYDFIRANGGWRALKFDFYNYTPPYLYLLTLSAGLFSSIHKVTAIKLVSIPFDFLCAYLFARIVRRRYANSTAAMVAFLVVLFTPTVFINGSLWGQIDIIYTTCLVATVFFLIRDRQALALLAFGLGLSFKLQAMFLFPVLLILGLSGRIRWRLFAIIPVTYFVMMIPAWAAGRPLGDLLSIYLTQGTADELLSLNAPNMYTWLPDALFDTLYPAGMILASAIVLIFVAVVIRIRPRMTAGFIVEMSTISVLLMPYILPKMHDRYFFPADVFSILFAFFYPRYLVVPVLVQLVSIFAYLPFLFGYGIIPFRTLAIFELAAIVILAYHFILSLSQSERNAGTEISSV